MRINTEVTSLAKIEIIFDTLGKILRGFKNKIFLKKSSGLLFVGKHVHIKNKQFIETGKNVKFESYSEIQGLCKEKLSFGNNVTVGRNVQIRPSSYYGVGNIGMGITIDDNSSIGPNSYIGCAGKIVIGKNVMIGPNVTMIAENHNFRDINVDIKFQGVNQKGIIIEDNVWIGANSVILDGSIIKEGTIIGADTLVDKIIPKNSIFINKREKLIRSRM